MGRNTKTTQNSSVTTEPLGSQGSATTPKPKRRRNRSKKQRPTDIASLIVALNDGALDQRHTAARDALAVRDALSKEPRQVATALVRDALALDAVIMSRISAELLRPDSNLIDAFGNPHELIRVHWPDIRAGILRGSKALVELVGRKAANTGDGETASDITSIILEAQRDVDSH